MARSMWRGAIQFGLVTIPVRLYLATEANAGLSFNLLHKTCLNRIQMKMYCPYHEEYINRADTVRGFEWSKGEYVIITDEDLESVPLKTVRSIEIELFVDARKDSHGAQFVKQAYYLEPEPVGRKAFYLLKSVLGEKGLSAICKVVIKDREHLAALNPYSSTMLLTSLYWPDEVRSIDELELPEEQQEFRAAERKMAEQLVAAMTGDFTADDYKDDYRQALLAVLEAKIAGRAPRAAEPEKPATKLVDLMTVLEASVEAAKGSRRARPAEAAADAEEPLAVAASGRRGRGRAQPTPSTAPTNGRRRRGSAAEEAAPPQRKRKTA
ncbi:MAG TPA: Ku protein [Candidatus Limnocylindrales bacterium]|jgi:DNA end-binding protein Ku|nr:Ku protein [Candidatus Limnocylindrales bacterium]